MRFDRRLHQRGIRRHTRPRRRTPLGRGTTLERLEGRELLSGSPWQNPYNPRDVNNDLRVSPSDALVIVNDLLANGAHALESAEVAPLAATQNVGPMRYVDVNGDSRVTPADLLIVVNELQDVELMRIQVIPTDLDGNVISTIAAGEQYKLQAVATDIRDPAAELPGVFAAGVDVSFNPTFSSIDTGQAVEFNGFFNLVHTATLSSNRVIAYVSTSNTTPPGNDPQMLWSVVLTATGSGTQMFLPQFDTDDFHETLLYGLDPVIPLTADEIDFVPATLDVVGEAFFIDDVSQAEDSGTPFNFTVTLSSPLEEAVTVEYTTSDGTATLADNDYEFAAGTLTFQPGETMMTIPVTVNPDTNIEPDEVFFVTLSNPSGGVSVSQGTAVGTILNEDLPPSLSVGDATVTAGPVDTIATFQVTLTGQIDQPVNVGFATADGTAIAGTDYQQTTGSLTFTPGGPTVQEIQVTVLASPLPKPDKMFFVNLSSVSDPDVVIGDGTGVGTIITQGISISDVTVVEGNSGTTPAVFTVSLSRMTEENVTVVYETADVTATAGEDYAATSGTITFLPGGSQTQMVTVLVNGDLDPETNERFAVNLSNPQGAPLFTSQGIGTILNDDGQKMAIRLEVLDSTGAPLATNDALDVGEDFMLKVYVTDLRPDPSGVASAYIDVTYEANLAMPTGPVTYGSFYDSIQSGTFETGLLDDFGAFGGIDSRPPDPAAELLLFSVPFEALSVGLVTFDASIDDINPALEIGLYDDDTPVQPGEINIEDRTANIGNNVITVNSVMQPESNNLVFTVTRFLPNASVATVVYTTVDQTATAPQDYVAKSGTLTFAGGEASSQMITILVNDDTIDEPDETLLLQLSSPVGATIGGPGTGTILDNDGIPTVSLSNASAPEGEGVVFTASLSSPSGKTVTVAFNTSDGTALQDVDYTPAAGTLTFAPGVTQRFVTVTALGDVKLEPDETFQLTLSSPVNATLGTSQGQGTIFDVPPAGLSGFVYVDLNNNGIKEASETGIAGAIVTATRPSDGFTKSAVTGADGSYVLTELLPGDYELTETQPGFYIDGRDTRFGVDSPVNDRFTGISLAASEAEPGYNFGELGIRSEFITAFINRRALFATAVVAGSFGPTLNMTGSTLNLGTGEIWVSFDGGWSGLRTIEATYNSAQGSVFMKLYNNALHEVAASGATATGSMLLFNGQAGQPYFLRLSGTNPNVTVEVTDTVLPNSAPAADPSGESDSPPATDPTDSDSSAADPAGKLASAAVPMTAPSTEPLVSSDASDEALDENEDWLLEALLT